ncbi:hypothetical protein K466DRAFT_650688 [Polyporus arcularius HHB13444]|uniref:Uncharacterized protein n=1 Tax=Polyporus arcularius HHB13444 TaxID=1314778 RepID=A0A5C3PQS6_9APHY|nr:hypothetical protein K466DRAFT_650688 [Polyporus arcularius HHB13444]
MVPSWKSLPGVPSSAPTQDVACSSCSNPASRWYRHKPFASHFLVGEVVSLRESVHTPIDAIFKTAKLALHPVEGLKAGGYRPAIVVDKPRLIHPIGTQELPAITAYLLTSYRDIHSSKLLPAILKDHFAIPISPHCEIESCTYHLHTSPEWQKPNRWLIAYPVTSGGTVCGPWSWENARGVAQEDLSFKIGVNDMDELQSVCDERMNIWTECCAKKGYLEKCAETYRIFMNSAAWESRIRQFLPDRIHEIAGIYDAPQESQCEQDSPATSGGISFPGLEPLLHVVNTIMAFPHRIQEGNTGGTRLRYHTTLQKSELLCDSHELMRLVLQMSKGNLKTMNPWPLVVDLVKQDIDNVLHVLLGTAWRSCQGFGFSRLFKDAYSVLSLSPLLSS